MQPSHHGFVRLRHKNCMLRGTPHPLHSLHNSSIFTNLVLLLTQSPLYSLAPQFPQCVRRNPSSRARITFAQLFRDSNRLSIKLPVSLSNIPQRPVYRLLNEVPVVIALALDHLQKLCKLFVRRLFVFVAQIRDQGKSRPLVEQLAPLAPGVRLLPRKLVSCVQTSISLAVAFCGSPISDARIFAS